MHRHRKLLLFLFLFAIISALVVGAVVRHVSDDKTYYQGRTLFEWVEAAGRDDSGSEQARAAIRAIGTNAVPTLLAWIRSEAPGWRWRRRVVARVFPRFARNTRLVLLLNGAATGNKVYQAVNAFYILGTNAAPAIPELLIISKDTSHPHNAFYAINALSLLGPPAFPHMAAALGDTNRPYRDDFARDLVNLAASVGTNRCQARLEEALLDPAPAVRYAAALALKEIDCETNAPVTK